MDYNQFEKEIDTIISNNINKMLSEENFKEIFQLVADNLPSEMTITQNEFDNICQISAAVSKGVSKHIVYATLDSLHQINELRDNLSHQ